MRRASVPGAMLALALLGACVSAPARPGRGVAVRPERTAARPRAAPTAAATPELPSGPVAAPATDARSVNSSIVVSVAPLGVAPYDGQTLPLVSPDGRFVAVQTGEAPTWATVLAQRDAAAPLLTSIEVYDLTAVPLKRVEWPAPLPPGLLLGASTGSGWFSAERVLPDGARTVERVAWVTGAPESLGADSRVLAAYTEGGGLSAWTDRASDGVDAALVIRSEGRESRRSEPGVSYMRPLVDGPRRGVFAFALGANGALEVRRVEPAFGASAIVRAKRTIARGADALVAHQAASGASVPPPALKGEPEGPSEAPLLLYFDPGAGRMAVFDASSGGVTLLARGSIAGCWLRDAGGLALFLTTPEGLVFQRFDREPPSRGAPGGWRASPTARVLAEPWVARATTDPDRPFVLIGPAGPGQESLLRLAAMRVVPSGPER